MGKAKRKRKELKRKMAALVNPQPPVVIEGPDFDPQTIWREHVADYTHGYIEEDGYGWNPTGYL